MRTSTTSTQLAITESLTTGVRSLMVSVANSWLRTFDQAFYSQHPRHNIDSTVNHLFDIICCLTENLKCVPQDLFVPIVLYADKFVRVHGIKHNQLFNLLLSSLMVCVKFWSESAVVSNRRIATLFQYSLPDLNVMERRFLLGIDYKLPLTKESVNEFLLYAVQTQIPSLLPSKDTTSTCDITSTHSTIVHNNNQIDYISTQKKVAKKRLAESLADSRKSRCTVQVNSSVDDEWNNREVYIPSRDISVEPILINH